MRFQTSKPVSGEAFFDRQDELRMLTEALSDIRHGVPRYYAILGLRKVGKSSLLWELKRRSRNVKDVVVVLLDCSDSVVDAATFFEDLIVEVIDEFLLKSGHAAQCELLAGSREDDLRLGAAVGRIQALRISALSAACDTLLGLRAGTGALRERFRAAADLPNVLAADTGLKYVIILDEFQECTKLNEFKNVQQSIGDVFAFFRSHWQRHAEVCYFISGSEIRLLEKIIQSETSPFFQHFPTLRLSSFATTEATDLCRELFADSGRSLPQELLKDLVTLAAGHPFYLQVLGEELCARSPDREIVPPVFKEIVQDTLFANAGRLSLYFGSQFEKHVKSSTSLGKTLSAIAAGHHRVTDIARELGQVSGAVGSWLSRLLEMDLIRKEAGGYVFQDPVFELWVRGTKTHQRSAIGPTTLGDQVERAVASKVAAEGFSLVYQARASKGAFDLLAVLNTFMVGLQVKKTKGPTYYLSKTERNRMVEWGKRLGWRPVLCLYQAEEEVAFLPVERLVSTKRGYRADSSKGSATLLALVSS